MHLKIYIKIEHDKLTLELMMHNKVSVVYMSTKSECVVLTLTATSISFPVLVSI